MLNEELTLFVIYMWYTTVPLLLFFIYIIYDVIFYDCLIDKLEKYTKNKSKNKLQKYLKDIFENEEIIYVSHLGFEYKCSSTSPVYFNYGCSGTSSKYSIIDYIENEQFDNLFRLIYRRKKYLPKYGIYDVCYYIDNKQLSKYRDTIEYNLLYKKVIYSIVFMYLFFPIILIPMV